MSLLKDITHFLTPISLAALPKEAESDADDDSTPSEGDDAASVADIPNQAEYDQVFNPHHELGRLFYSIPSLISECLYFILILLSLQLEPCRFNCSLHGV